MNATATWCFSPRSQRRLTVNAARSRSSIFYLFGVCLPIVFVLAWLPEPSQADEPAGDCVVLLHGLARTAASMQDMQENLQKSGFLVANIDYPSREHPIEELAYLAVPSGITSCLAQGATRIHFVTHSLGGILVRQYLAGNTIPDIGRVVMLAPPNHGSEVVDNMRDVPGYLWLNGPAGQQLGTDADSVPINLGSVKVDVAVIAGTNTINLILSTYLPDPDDGKVSVASARIDGMCAMLTMPVSHPFIMEDGDVIDEVIAYLKSGHFLSAEAQYPACDNRIEG